MFYFRPKFKIKIVLNGIGTIRSALVVHSATFLIKIEFARKLVMIVVTIISFQGFAQIVIKDMS